MKARADEFDTGMLTAFTKLGYNCYHFLEAARMQTAGERHLDYWLEGFKIKMYGNGEPFGRSEFDKILGDYSVGIPQNSVLILSPD